MSCAQNEPPPPLFSLRLPVGLYVPCCTVQRFPEFHDIRFRVIMCRPHRCCYKPSACSHHQAYAVLGDPKRREKYDRDGHPATAAVSAGAAAAAAAAASKSASRAASAPPAPPPAPAPAPAPVSAVPTPPHPQYVPEHAHGGWGGNDVGGGWEGMPVGGDYGQGWVSLTTT